MRLRRSPELFVPGLLLSLVAVQAVAQDTYALAPLEPELVEVTHGALGAPFFTYTHAASVGSLQISVTTNNNVTGSGTIAVVAPESLTGVTGATDLRFTTPQPFSVNTALTGARLIEIVAFTAGGPRQGEGASLPLSLESIAFDPNQSAGYLQVRVSFRLPITPGSEFNSSEIRFLVRFRWQFTSDCPPEMNLSPEASTRQRAASPCSVNPPPNPYSPEPATDSRFVVETGPGLKTACAKRSDGPLRIVIPVDRVVGEVDSQHLLSDTRSLSSVSNVTLRMPVFHALLPGGTRRLRDRVRLNGNDNPDGAQYVKGKPGEWTLNSVTFFATVARFGRRIRGQKPAPGDNELEIVIDPVSGGVTKESWCTIIDWVELSFGAIAPVIMVHGNGQGDDGKGGEFWSGAVLDEGTGARLQMKSNVIQSFAEAGIPFDNSISMPTDTTEAHGDLLGKKIPEIAAEFGARRVHLLAHSKGALDVRDFMARKAPANFAILSLTTLSGVHAGSSGPDYQIDAVGASALWSDDKTRTTISQEFPPGKGTPSLRVSEVERFNQKNIPLLPRQMTVDGETLPVRYTNVVADANLDDSQSAAGNPTISFNETEGIPGQGSMMETKFTLGVEQVYRIIGYVARTRVESYKTPTGTTVPVVKETPTQVFQLNDFCVTHASGSYLVEQLKGQVEGDIHRLKANHSTVATREAALIAIEAIRKAQRTR
ncbi:MAG: hypothetical protein KIT09_03905 [Bryobacteraceae bacterium]|nr:hypothetical protein [Bryobacteraceae bacterium]